jgi:hypothetical protein
MADDGELSAEELGEELENLASFVGSGSYKHPPRLNPRELLDVVQRLAEAALARMTLGRERPIKPKQLAALARVNTERLRHLPRTEDGYIEPRAAKEWVSSYVTGIELQELQVTPSWWQSVLPGDKLRRMAEDIVRRELPTGTVLAPEDRLTRISIGVPPGVLIPQEDLLAARTRIATALEQLTSHKPR